MAPRAGNASEADAGRETHVPPGCVSWFDGCNKCSVVDGRLGGCTRNACDAMGPAGCKRFAESAIPGTCTSWFDGCNTCAVTEGRLGGCTYMLCEVLAQPHCKHFASAHGAGPALRGTGAVASESGAG